MLFLFSPKPVDDSLSSELKNADVNLELLSLLRTPLGDETIAEKIIDVQGKENEMSVLGEQIGSILNKVQDNRKSSLIVHYPDGTQFDHIPDEAKEIKRIAGNDERTYLSVGYSSMELPSIDGKKIMVEMTKYAKIEN